jgi:hypothetical protein
VLIKREIRTGSKDQVNNKIGEKGGRTENKQIKSGNPFIY